MFGKVTTYHGTALVEAEIISTDVPDVFPLNTDGIDNIGNGYKLAPGSTLYVTGIGRKYRLGTDGDWNETKE